MLYNSGVDHRYHDRVSLEMATIVAKGLAVHPEWLTLARDNLRRWSERNADAPGLLRCYAEWQAILDRPVPEIVATLLDKSDNGRRLRTNSPFAGVLGPREVWALKRRIRDELTAGDADGHTHEQSAA